ncbi:MAG: Flagellar biosynthesis chaperone [Candidatus Tokpelaia sp. JSC161]|jgi:hypothetical protein|nr:MAG: Flagellar biosynthesis chaperone [Candidatus Tokpelaia sp. JSC161]RCL03606.1 MAG: Flagellar biosynthesis chaperone [Candidatus Tokpelaia sp. JSC161]
MVMLQQKKIGRPSTIKYAIISFVKNLKNDISNYSDLWEHEWKTFSNKSLCTRTIYTSRYRIAVRKEYGERHPALNAIRILDKQIHLNQIKIIRKYNHCIGRKPTCMNNIKNFISKVHTLDKTHSNNDYQKNLNQLWLSELNKMQSHLKNNTILTRISAYRNALRQEKLINKITLSIIKAPHLLQKERYTQYRANIAQQHYNLIALHKWKEILQIAQKELLKKNIPWKSLQKAAQEIAPSIQREQAVTIGIALEILTGRRPFEIFCQGKFSPLECKNSSHSNIKYFESWHVLFNGQTKTRENLNTQFNKYFKIPVLAKAKDIIFSLMVIQSSTNGKIWQKMNNEEFWNDLLRTPNPKCILPHIRRNLLNKVWPYSSLKNNYNLQQINTNNIRAFYAECAAHFFKPKSKSKIAYYAEILGHRKKDIETASAYIKYYIPN